MNSSLTLRLLSLAGNPANTAEESSPNSAVSDLVTDEELISQICLNSKEALAQLFRRYAKLIHTVSRRILQNQAEADDFVQDVFLNIHRDARSFNAKKGVARTWILQMAYRRAISRRRYLSAHQYYAKVDLEEAANQAFAKCPIAGTAENVIDEEFGRGTLKKVFDELSTNQRETLRLFFMQGYTFDEIATKLGQSRGNIKHHYFRGLEKLRRHLFTNKLPGERTI